MDVKLNAICPRGKPLAHGTQGVLDRTDPASAMPNHPNRRHESGLTFVGWMHGAGKERLPATGVASRILLRYLGCEGILGDTKD